MIDRNDPRQDIEQSVPLDTNLSPEKSELRDALIVEQLAKGAPYHSAAKAANTSERTVRRRMADAEFRARVVEARRELLTRLTGKAMASGEEALEVIQRVMREGSTAEALRAASLMLSATVRLHDAAEFRDQMDDLKAELREKRVQGSGLDE